MQRDAKRYRRKSFHIKTITRVQSNSITNFSFGVKLEKTNKYFVAISDTTGVYRIGFSDGSFMYYAKWLSGGGKSKTTEALYAAEEKVWLNFLKAVNIERRKIERPKNGTYRIANTHLNGLVYRKLKKMQETPIVHPSIEIVKNDMEYYFNNIELFTRFGMPGVRKVLLVGPPGTGKTSFSIKLAKSYEHEKCVVFATSISDVATHLYLAAKYQISTIVILEDAESTLQQANSELLNFLDGIDLPKNEHGSYVIMTTNHPNRIEPRIYKRAGRIDKIVQFGPLKGKYALKCAEIYFNNILIDDAVKKNKKKLKKIKIEMMKIVDNMSGAEIKELAQSSASYAASSRKAITTSLIKDVKDGRINDIENVLKYMEDDSSMSKNNKVGFEKKEKLELATEFGLDFDDIPGAF